MAYFRQYRGDHERQWRAQLNAAIEGHAPRVHPLMRKLFSLTPRQYLIVAHDLAATALAIVASFFIRFGDTGFPERLDGLIRFLPGFVVYAAIVYLLFGLHAS